LFEDQRENIQSIPIEGDILVAWAKRRRNVSGVDERMHHQRH
jgi:hypothetical protein